MIPRRGLISFDVEEWFHLLDADAVPERMRWDELPSRAPEVIRRLVDVLAAHEAHATFFVLGWFARKHPKVVRALAAAGHEIASHSDTHPLLYELGMRAVADELARGKDVLEQIIGAPVRGFRAPGFSIRHENAWALDAVVQAGFQYDSSVFPAARAHGGMPGFRAEPHLLRTPCGAILPEIPVSTRRVLGWTIAFGGGGYFRLAPIALTLSLARSIEREGRPFVSYLHPRDLDPDTPRLTLGAWRAFKCYVGLRSAPRKLAALLAAYRPIRYVEYVRERGWLPADMAVLSG